MVTRRSVQLTVDIVRGIFEYDTKDWRIELGNAVGFCHITPIVDFTLLVDMLFKSIAIVLAYIQIGCDNKSLNITCESKFGRSGSRKKKMLGG